MLRFLAQIALSLLANAVGIAVAAALVDGFSIDGASFIIALVIFTGLTAILGPFIASVARRHAPYLLGGIALVTTFVGLLLTVLISDGISINGVSAWVVSTLIIWLFSVLASVVLPLFLFKSVLEDRKDDK